MQFLPDGFPHEVNTNMECEHLPLSLERGAASCSCSSATAGVLFSDGAPSEPLPDEGGAPSNAEESDGVSATAFGGA